MDPVLELWQSLNTDPALTAAADPADASVLVAAIEHLAADDEDDTATDAYLAWLAPIGVETNDGSVDFVRVFRDLGWREPPLPLTFSDSEMAHDDAVFVGNLVDFAKRDRDGTEWVVATVEWDVDDEATEARRLVDEGKVRGVSVHLSDMEAEFVCTEESDEGWCVSGVLDVATARIAAATIVLIPAFEAAEIEPVAAIGESLASFHEGVRAGLTAASLRKPPRDWFDDPQLAGPTPVTVTDDGRVFGHLALWGTCHRGYTGVCITPPRDGTDYADFHANSHLECEDNVVVAVGCITMDAEHAGPNAGRADAARHYADTALTVAYVRAGEDTHGVWVSGALRPGVTDDQIDTLRRHQLSGDWRPHGDRHSLIAALVVNVPGFPIAASIRSGETVRYSTLSPLPAAPSHPVVEIVRRVSAEVLALREDLAPLLAEVAEREAAALFASFTSPPEVRAGE
jgi:hypothetical protein